LGGGHKRLPGFSAHIFRELEPPVQAVRDRFDCTFLNREGNELRGLGWQRRGKLLGDLPHPRVPGGHRQHPASSSLSGDHSKRLGERARHHQRLSLRQQLGHLVMLKPADELDGIHDPPGRIQIAVGRIDEKRAQNRQRLRGTALQSPPQFGDLAGVV